MKKVIKSVHDNRFNAVKELIKAGANINTLDNYMVLNLAAYSGNLEIVKELIQAGINVNIPDKHGYSALHQAAYNGYIDIVKEIIKAGADVNIKNVFGDTALFRAINYIHFEVVKDLIKAGADIDVVNNNGYTPISLASEIGCQDIIDYLKITKQEKILSDLTDNVKEELESSNKSTYRARYSAI